MDKLLCHLVPAIPCLLGASGVLGYSGRGGLLSVCYTAADTPVLGLLQVAWLSL